MRFIRTLTEQEAEELREGHRHGATGRERTRALAVLGAAEASPSANWRRSLACAGRRFPTGWSAGSRGAAGLCAMRPARGVLRRRAPPRRPPWWRPCKPPRPARRANWEKRGLAPGWDTLKGVLHRLGWRFRGTRRTTAKAPAAHRGAATRKALSKLRRLEEAGRVDLFYGDESGCCLQPTLGRCWQPPGPTLGLPAQAHGQRLNVAGFRRGDGALCHFQREGRLGGAEFIEAVEGKLLTALRGRPAVRVLDSGPCHRSRLVKAKRAGWRAKGRRLLFLPPYCPHLNRIETLWRMVKHPWLAPAAYASFASLCQSVGTILDHVGSDYRVTFS